MSIAAMNYVGGLMNRLGIPYAFMRKNTKAGVDYYFVGEYDEVAMTTREENGRQDTNFILRGFTRKDWLLLEEAKAKIEKHASFTAILPDGTGMAVSYDGATIVPTGDAELKSIKINLTIREWRVN